MDKNRVVDLIREAAAEGKRTFLRWLDAFDLVRAREDLQGWKSTTKQLLRTELGREPANQFDAAGNLDILYPSGHELTTELGKHVSFLFSLAGAIERDELPITEPTTDPALANARLAAEMADRIADAAADANRIFNRRFVEGDVLGARNELQHWKSRTKQYIYENLGRKLAAMFDEAGDFDVIAPGPHQIMTAVGQHLRFLQMLIEILQEKSATNESGRP